MDKKGYQVKLEVFEGPLDLLLHLIKKDELNIYDISIERLALQYMEYLESFNRLNIPLASEFMVMASNLMYIKSRSLLPKKIRPPDDEADDDDPKWDLIRQLLEYKKFKEAALYLKEKQAIQTTIFAKQISLDSKNETRQDLPENASIFELVKAFQSVIKRYEEEHEVGEIINDHFSVSDKISSLMEKFSDYKKREFNTLFNNNTSKQELIVTFLALLELVKLRKLEIEQSNFQTSILIFKPSTP